MSDPSGSSDQAGSIDLTRADFEGGQPPTCASCQAPIGSSYFTINGAAVCERCKLALESSDGSSSGAARLLKAGLFGFAAAAVGAALWMAVTEMTGYEIGLIAVAVGFFVGSAVRLGSEGRGGRGYQGIAVLLTYLAIVATYVPAIIGAIAEEEERGAAATVAPSDDGGYGLSAADAAEDEAIAEEERAARGDEAETHPLPPTVQQIVVAVLLAMAIPFLQGFENIIGILIIGFALWEAWRRNARAELRIDGPFRVSSPSASA